MCQWLKSVMRGAVLKLGQVKLAKLTREDNHGRVCNSKFMCRMKVFVSLWYFTWWILSLMDPLVCRKKPVIERSYLKLFAVINKGPVTSEELLELYCLIHLQTQPIFLNLLLPSSLSLLPSLECQRSVGGFNVAFNPHRFIITLTFTLYSIKFLTADLLQWLFCIAEGCSNYAGY